MESYNKLLSYISNIGCTYTVTKQDERGIQLDVHKGNFTLKVVYDNIESVYGFYMIGVGMKPYTSFTEFKESLELYIFMHTDFLPKANMMSDFFEGMRGITAVYSHHVGDRGTGYTAIFAVQGNSEQFICVDGTDDLYRLKFTDCRNVVAVYNFKVDGVGNIVPIITPDYYADLIFNKYISSSDLQFTRIENDKFGVLSGGIKVLYNIFLDDNLNPGYRILRINDMHLDKVFTPKDITAIESLLECASQILSEDSQSQLSHQITQSHEQEQEQYILQSGNKMGTEGNTGNTDNVGVSDVVDTTESEEFQEVFVGTVDTVLNDKKDGVSDMDNVKVMLVKKDGVVEYVRFIREDGLYDMSVGVAENLGVPIKRIVSSTDIELVNGMLITKEERQRKQFSKEVTDDKSLCEELISYLFD